MVSVQTILALAALCGSAQASYNWDNGKVSPIEKVITMMEDLQTETLVEGKAEAKTYDKFACFCKDNTMEKTDAITEGQDKQAELEASLAAAFAKRESLDKTIAEASEVIAEKEKGVKDADAQRAKDKEEFKLAEADCFTFKKEIDFAVVELMSAGGAFLEVKSTVRKYKADGPDAVRQGLEELDRRLAGSDPKQSRFIAELLDMSTGTRKVPGAGGVTGGVVKTVKELKPGMEETLKILRADEVKSKHQYQMVVQGLTDEKKAEQKTMDDAKKDQAANTEAIGKDSADLTLTQGTLADDQAFLKTLTKECNLKSKAWDQRSAARAGELTALTNAITIVKSKVATKASFLYLNDNGAARPVTAALQEGTSAKKVDAPADEDRSADDDVLGVADQEVERETGELSFLQVTPRKQAVSLLQRPLTASDGDAAVKQMIKDTPDYDEMDPTQKELARAMALSKFSSKLKGPSKVIDPVTDLKNRHEENARAKVIGMLKTQATHLHSNNLAAIAAKMETTGPFDKITKLIQELIERLLQEQADEASHQGWCNTELGKAKAKRDRAADDIKTLNTDMGKNEALRDKLTEETAKLTAEIEELKENLAKQTKERADEKAENEVTITESKEGKEAVDEALDMLDKFYKTAAKNTVLAQESSAAPEMPDAGFDGAYQGGQGASTGILGMLEVISGDFARTIKTTEAAEKEAASSFMEFETESKMSIATKTNMDSAKDTELTETNGTLDEENTSLQEEQKLLDKAIQELLELEPACFPKAEPYAERVAKREQEIESLKTALCTLDKEGPVQTEAGDCGSF